MNFFAYIRSWFIWATNVLVNLAIDCYMSPLLPDFLGDAFSSLSDFTSMVAGYLWDASKRWEEVEAAIADILSWSNIKGLIRDWLPDIDGLVAWWAHWWDSVRGVINSWWGPIWDSVTEWVEARIAGLTGIGEEWLHFWQNLWPALTDAFDKLKAAWDNFRDVTLPNLVSLPWLIEWFEGKVLEFQGLIDSAFKLREGLWEGWQDSRDNVIEFFSDPLEWLWGRFTDWFLGPEE